MSTTEIMLQKRLYFCTTGIFIGFTLLCIFIHFQYFCWTCRFFRYSGMFLKSSGRIFDFLLWRILFFGTSVCVCVSNNIYRIKRPLWHSPQQYCGHSHFPASTLSSLRSACTCCQFVSLSFRPSDVRQKPLFGHGSPQNKHIDRMCVCMF